MAIGGIYGSSTYMSKMRLTGLGGSGLDTDSIVSQLMQVEKLPMNKLTQKRQLALWKQDAYRDITSKLQTFKNDFFDILKPANNMLSPATFKKFNVTAMDGTTKSTVVSATGSANATAGTHSVYVKKMATADIALGTGTVTKELKGNAAIADEDVAGLNGKKLNVTLDGVTREVTIGNYNTVADLASGLQTQLSSLFGQISGVDKIKVTQAGGVLSFSTGAASVNKIILSSGTTDDAISALKFNSGDSNRLNTGMSLAQLAQRFETPLQFAGGTMNIDSSEDITDLALTGKEFDITIDGIKKTYTFTSDPASVADLAQTLDTWIHDNFDNTSGDKVDVTANGNKLSFTRNSAASLSITSGGNDVDAIGQLKIDSGSEANALLRFTINSKEFTIDASQSLTSLMIEVNNDSTANVNISYDEITDKFKIEAKQLGSGDNITISQDGGLGNFFSGASKISTGAPVTEQGHDAVVNIDGQELVRSTNAITVNGVTYTLLEESANEQKVTLSNDVDTVYNNIKNFVDKYNELIASLNGKISEKYDRDYQPLTDDQRNAMSDDQITKWETKAKTGLLRNDSIVQSFIYNIRNALSDGVSGVDLNLSSIGITTGTYDEKGKLYIDDTKLKTAIQNNPDGVMNLFTKTSDISYTDTSQRSQRYNEEGLAGRLSDLIQDSIRTSRDDNGNKGMLLEKAGIIGDSSEYKNTLYSEIYDYSQKIYDLSNLLIEKENRYYQKFSALETAMSKMQSQSSWIGAQLGAKG